MLAISSRSDTSNDLGPIFERLLCILCSLQYMSILGIRGPSLNVNLTPSESLEDDLRVRPNPQTANRIRVGML